MNLYEALKSGTTADELKETFTKELEEATAKLKKEKEEAQKRAEEKKAHEEYLDLCTRDLAYAFIDFYTALLGKEFSTEEVLKFNDVYEALKSINKINMTIDTDDKIIADFLKAML
jgi:ABC-type Zn uptake system ZnuABC Zn-binding protein ZnuA